MLRNSLLSGLRNTSGILNNSLPFGVPNVANTIASTSSATKALGTASKLSFTSILDNASKTINTINQIVPLYQQIKPMFNNAKTALNIFKTVKNIDTPIVNEPSTSTQPIIKNKEPETKKENIIEEPSIIITNSNPNKPFFV